MKKSKKIIVLIVALVLIASVFVACSNKNKEQETATAENSTITETVTNEQIETVTGRNGENDTLIPAKVNQIKDNKIIKVLVNDEIIEVCMIGIDVPNEQKSKELKYLNEVLKADTDIWLQYDESTMNDVGQHLCYIWIDNNVGLYSYTSCKTSMLQGILIDKNLAEPIEEYPNSRYEVIFNLINEKAEENYNIDLE